MAVKNNIFTMKEVNDETTSALFSQLGNLLGVGKRGDGRYYLADLCQASSINKFARYKPEDYPTDSNLTEAQRASNRYGFKNDTPYIKAGFSTPQHSVYQYQRPKGGTSSMNRLRDFNGYYHGAVSPLSLIFPQKVYIDAANGVSIRANDTGVTNYNPSTCVKLGDVMKATNDYYVALYIHKDTNNQWLLPTDVKVNDLSEAIFPSICFAAESSMLPAATGHIYNYIIPELANMKGQELTLIAVGVEALKYQTDKTPLGRSGTKLIGDRWMFSMELEENADRRTLSVDVAKTLAGLAATFTMSGKVTKASATINGRQAYYLTNLTSTLNVITPSDWMFTSQDTITLTAKVINNVGEMSKTDGTLVTTIEIPMAVTLKDAGATIPIKDLVSISNYNFNVWSGSNLSLNVTIIATAENGETKTLISNYTFSQPLP